jgi:flagellar hook-length control protein FliK
LQGALTQIRLSKPIHESFLEGKPVASLTPEQARTVVEHIVQEFSLHVREQVSEMRIRLKPEMLGEIFVRVQQDDTSVTAQIHVEHAGVKTAIDTQLPHLRQALLDQGVDVRRLEVMLADQSLAREFREQPHPKPKRRGSSQFSGFADLGGPLGPRSLGYNTIELVF